MDIPDPELQSGPRRAAWGLWVDLTTGLIPALTVGEIRPGEAADELAVALAAVELDAHSWEDTTAARVRDELVEAAELLNGGQQVDAAIRLLRSAAERLHTFAVSDR